MRALAVLGAFILALVGISAYADDGTRCKSGEAKAFVSIRTDPPYLVGTIPGRFTTDPGYFSRRYNCTGRSAETRRVGLGIYDVHFPGVNVASAVASALSDEGIAASVLPLEGGIVRISLRGPLVDSNVTIRRDVPFTVLVY